MGSRLETVDLSSLKKARTEENGMKFVHLFLFFFALLHLSSSIPAKPFKPPSVAQRCARMDLSDKCERCCNDCLNEDLSNLLDRCARSCKENKCKKWIIINMR